MLNKILMVVFLSCLVIISCCCLCGGLALLTGGGFLESTRDFISSPIRWFQPEETSPDLQRYLEQGTSAAFRVGEPCVFSSVAGNTIQSSADPGEQFARPLTRQEAIDIAQISLTQDLYQVEDRNITLDNGTPVRSQLVSNEGVYLAFDEQTRTESSVTSRSMNGVVIGNKLDGSFHLADDTSSVESGQGIETSSSIDVTFNCLFLWEN